MPSPARSCRVTADEWLPPLLKCPREALADFPQRLLRWVTNDEYRPMANHFTEKQGQYLAFVYNYTVLAGQAPSEADMARFFGKTPPTIHQMVLKLAELQLISRKPGEPRSIEILVDPDDIPTLLRPNPDKG